MIGCVSLQKPATARQQPGNSQGGVGLLPALPPGEQGPQHLSCVFQQRLESRRAAVQARWFAMQLLHCSPGPTLHTFI